MSDIETFDPGTPPPQDIIQKGGHRRSSGDGVKLYPECSLSSCRDDSDDKKFECEKCDRLVHYRCTQLPLYQIQRFLTKGFRKYICANCITIQPSLDNTFPSPPESVTQTRHDPNNMILTLRKEIEGKIKQVDALAETNRLLNVTIKDLTRNQGKSRDEINKLKDKVRLSTEKEKTMESLLNEREEELAKTLNKLHQLEQENQNNSDDCCSIVNDLKAKHIEEGKFKEAEITRMKETLETQSKTIANFKQVGGKSQTEVKTQGNESMANLTKFIDEKLEKVESNLKRSLLNEVSQINNKLEHKFNSVFKENRPSEPKPDLREIMRQQHDEHIAEESDRKQRACNIIVHGVAESVDDNNSDTNFVTKFFEDIGLKNIKHKSSFRIGKKKEDNETLSLVRPQKLVLNNERIKDKIMANLTKLKGKIAYARISITEDFSHKERLLLKEWASKAKDANDKEGENSNVIWRVRGSPKNRIFLKKFTKRNMDC